MEGELFHLRISADERANKLDLLFSFFVLALAKSSEKSKI